MRRLVTGVFVLLSVLASGLAAQELSRVCAEGEGASRCDVILVKDGAVVAASGAAGGSVRAYKVLGNYRRDLQPLVPAQEAPVDEIRFGSGARVIVAWTHARPPRLAGPVFRLRFYSAKGQPQAQVDGDLRLERFEGGRLFESPVDLLLMTMGGESGPSVITKVWRVEATKPPEVLLEVHGTAQQVDTGHGGSAPGIWIEYVVTGLGGSTDRWIRGFWEWLPRAGRFRWPGSLD